MDGQASILVLVGFDIIYSFRTGSFLDLEKSKKHLILFQDEAQLLACLLKVLK